VREERLKKKVIIMAKVASPVYIPPHRRARIQPAAIMDTTPIVTAAKRPPPPTVEEVPDESFSVMQQGKKWLQRRRPKARSSQPLTANLTTPPESPKEPKDPLPPPTPATATDEIPPIDIAMIGADAFKFLLEREPISGSTSLFDVDYEIERRERLAPILRGTGIYAIGQAESEEDIWAVRRVKSAAALISRLDSKIDEEPPIPSQYT